MVILFADYLSYLMIIWHDYLIDYLVIILIICFSYLIII